MVVNMSEWKKKHCNNVEGCMTCMNECILLVINRTVSVVFAHCTLFIKRGYIGSW